MTLHFDLLAFAGAQYVEVNGVKGVFIPEVPNFTYQPGTGFRRGATPARATLTVNMFKTSKQSQKYDWMGRQRIPNEYQDAYLSNPNMVTRNRYCVYGYNWKTGSAEYNKAKAAEFERLLED